MDFGLDAIADPADWNGTAFADLEELESCLHCHICKEFLETPVITSCSHTFCSLCIRRCLSHDGRCPTCRKEDQALRLRPNPILEDIVRTFQKARPNMLAIARNSIADGSPTRAVSPINQGVKRSRRESLSVANPRSVRRRHNAHDQSEIDPAAIVTSSSEFDGKRTISGRAPADSHADQIVPCPVCQKTMSASLVFEHLDFHTNPTPVNTVDIDRPERLPAINYSILNDQTLRKKMTVLGLSTQGGRAIIERRHREWVNIFNANIDSSTPKSQAELLKALDLWEKSQNQPRTRSAMNEPMSKTFDPTSWAAQHGSYYQKLIEDARKQNSLASTKKS